MPHAAWNPGTGTVRLAAGVGLWDQAAGRYLVPGDAATATTPGRRRRAARAAGVLQRRLPLRRAAARRQQPIGHGRQPGVVARPAAGPVDLRTGDLSPLPRRRRLRQARAPARATTAGVPQTGPINRILASHFETKQGVDFDSRVRQLERLPGRAARPAAALRALRPEEDAGALRLHAAHALAGGELQPVLGAAATSRSSASAGRATWSPRRRAAGPTAGTTTTPARRCSRCGPTSRATTRSTRR